MNESKSGLIFKWAMTDDLQEFVEIGKKLFPKTTTEFLIQEFEKSYKESVNGDNDERTRAGFDV